MQSSFLSRKHKRVSRVSQPISSGFVDLTAQNDDDDGNSCNNSCDSSKTTSNTSCDVTFVLDVNKYYYDIINPPLQSKYVNPNQPSYVFYKQCINHKNAYWEVKLTSVRNRISIGVCYIDIIYSNYITNTTTNASSSHGSFLLSSDNYRYNCMNASQDNKCFKIGFDFYKGDVFILEYIAISSLLLIRKKGAPIEIVLPNVYSSPPKKGEDCYYLVPCVLLSEMTDRVEMLNVRIYS